MAEVESGGNLNEVVTALQEPSGRSGARDGRWSEVNGGQSPQRGTSEVGRAGGGGRSAAGRGGPGSPLSPGSPAPRRRGALLRSPHEPPASSASPAADPPARRSVCLTRRRRPARPARTLLGPPHPPDEAAVPPASPARLGCLASRSVRLNRPIGLPHLPFPPPPSPPQQPRRARQPRPPPASRPNAETGPALIGYARHVTATLRRRQFQTAEQTESLRAGPHPRPRPGTTPPPPPFPGSRDSPPRSRGRGPARRWEQRGASRSRRVRRCKRGPSPGFRRPPQPSPGLDVGSMLVILNGE
ncbi:basic proline-rich protein-like [Eschrichtius robustus]|uniref:basic proline-rich protein-like n=1 Tax=Eschrichtius robustus TaxID=9764 RepID=UPI0035C01F69